MRDARNGSDHDLLVNVCNMRTLGRFFSSFSNALQTDLNLPPESRSYSINGCSQQCAKKDMIVRKEVASNADFSLEKLTFEEAFQDYSSAIVAKEL